MLLRNEILRKKSKVQMNFHSKIPFVKFKTLIKLSIILRDITISGQIINKSKRMIILKKSKIDRIGKG